MSLGRTARRPGLASALAISLAVLFGGCADDSPSTVLLRIEAGGGLDAPDHLRLELYGADGWEVRGKRLPAAGRVTLPNEVVLYPPRAAGTLRVVVRAVGSAGSAGATTGEGTGQVALQSGAQVELTVQVRPGRRPDRDGDGVPDAVDNCPDEANPEQAPCGGGDGPVNDAGDGPLPDGPGDGPAVDFGDGPRPEGPSSPDGLVPDTLGPDTGPPPPPPSLVVTADGWGLRSPVYPSVDLLGVHGSARTNVWVVGRNGLAMHFDGVQWKIHPTGTTEALHAVWTPGPGAAWACGEKGVVLRFASGVWSPVASGTGNRLTGIWGASSSDIWAIGENKTALHWTGSAWTQYAGIFDLNDANAISGLSSSQIWAVGRRSGNWEGVAFYNGASWQTPVGTVVGNSWKDLLGVFPLSPTEVWVVDKNGRVGQPVGGGVWTSEHTPTGEELRGVWAAASNDIWVVGRNGVILHRTSGAWQQVSISGNPSLNAIWGSAASDIWAVGNAGAVWHYDGTKWSAPPAPVTSTRLYAAWRATSGALFVVGDSGTILVRSVSGQWTKETSGTNNSLHGIWGATLPDVWAVGSSGVVLRRTASGWSQQASFGSSYTVYGISGTAATNIWAVGGRCTTDPVTFVTTCTGRTGHFDGTKWSTSNLGNKRLRGVWAGPQEAWIVGDDDSVYRRPATQWVKVGLPGTPDLNSVWGDGTGKVWIVGNNGLSFVYSGGTIGTLAGAGGADLYAVVGSAPGLPVWAVGQGKILRLVGSTWTTAGIGATSSTLRGLVAGAVDDIWAVGDSGTILHHDDRP